MIRNSLPFTLRSLRERGRGRKWRVHRSWIIFWTTIFTFYRATFTQVVCAHFGGCQLPPFSEAVRRSWKGFEGVNVHTALHGCMVNQQNSRDSGFWRNGEWYSGTSYLDFFWTLHSDRFLLRGSIEALNLRGRTNRFFFGASKVQKQILKAFRWSVMAQVLAHFRNFLKFVS